MPLAWVPCLRHGSHAFGMGPMHPEILLCYCSHILHFWRFSRFLHFSQLWVWSFTTAKPLTREHSGWSQMKQICVGYLPYRWRVGDHSARKLSQLPKNIPNEKWKPKFLRNSQKSKSFFDFFLLKATWDRVGLISFAQFLVLDPNLVIWEKQGLVWHHLPHS